MDDVKISKFMSLVLRHEPQALGVELDANGWTDFVEFSDKLTAKLKVSRQDIEKLVATNPKQRFIIANGRIRANQGHSVEIDLALNASAPPATLFHGTTDEAWQSIKRQGLVKRERTHVHLSKDVETAEIVSKRRKAPWVILTVNTVGMSDAGSKFYLADNGVWLVEHVPAQFIGIEKQLGTK
jgi:putative RNA 2'-phosphotransferase